MLPGVASFQLAGVKGFVVDTWFGLLSPAGTPPEVVKVLEQQATEFGKSSAVRERLLTVGMEAQTVCGDAFAQQIVTEIGFNTKLAQEYGLKPE